MKHDERPIAVLGVPTDEASSFLRGCRLGPEAIRAALRSRSANWFAEDGTDLEHHPRITDTGDVELVDGPGTRESIERDVGRLVTAGSNVLSLGGDHAITYPILRAHAAAHGPLDLLQFDAHPDLYDELDGDRYSHACPFARAHEEGLIRRHVQLGVRTMTAHQREQAARFGVTVVPAWEPPAARPELDGPLYVTLDLDVLDPAFAPGVSHHEPGGLSVRDVLGVVHRLGSNVVGADVVELNPSRDLNGVTAMVAAKLVRELLAVMLR